MTRTPRAPAPEGLNLEFYEQAADGTLHLQQCAHCERFRHPPRHLCPHCHSPEYRWTPASGEAELFSWTVTHFAFDRGWADDLPYTTVVATLDEGVRVIGSGEELPRDGLASGIRLRARVDTERYGFPFVTFSAAAP